MATLLVAVAMLQSARAFAWSGASDSGRLPTVTVERFVYAWPTQSCERVRAHTSLTNIYWHIVRLYG